MPGSSSKVLWATLPAGVLFGFGLAWSTMIRPDIVLGFLRLHDMGLLLVMGGGAGVAMLFFQLAPRLMKKPVLEAQFEGRKSAAMSQTIIGSAIFGVGWGLCGVCPGPALAGLGAGEWPLAWVLLGLFLGAWLHGLLAPVEN